MFSFAVLLHKFFCHPVHILPACNRSYKKERNCKPVDIKLIPNHFFALCIGIIMMVCANTCIAQETEQFKLVKNVTELQEGDIVIVVNNTNEHCSALSTKWDYRKIDGYKIDIKPASQAEPAVEPEEAETVAEGTNEEA